jgi:hypothetical protein
LDVNGGAGAVGSAASKFLTRIARKSSKATDDTERKKNSLRAKGVATLLRAIRGFAAFPCNPSLGSSPRARLRPCFLIHPRSLDLPRRNGLDTLLCHEWAPVPVWRESAQNQCREPLILPGSAPCHRLWPPLLPGTSAKSMTQGTRACRQLSRTALAARQGCAAK